jgi:hypothetical protein
MVATSTGSLRSVILLSTIRLTHLQAHGGFEYRHLRRSGQEVRQLALVTGIEMLHQEKGHACISGQALQQLAECLQTTG